MVRSKGSSARLNRSWDKGCLCTLGIQLNIGNPAHRGLHTFSTQQVGKLHENVHFYQRGKPMEELEIQVKGRTGSQT